MFQVLTGKSKAPMVTTSKVLSHKVTSRVDSGKPKGGGAGSQPLAPPMSSVVVERHQPVNKVRYSPRPFLTLYHLDTYFDTFVGPQKVKFIKDLSY
ncbi:hypothetical protein DPMN_156188 [Dreissena polymorpha]|uniref:Uncharacterized protein n=1 Tax=Dreissena polymorpha TaxID=45954 RepID=A0A9D4FPC6_DREPO|nr:hypothetical protein DPMN_156188 [Dreissena polymorpha]